MAQLSSETSGAGTGYEAPALTIHGSVAELTGAALAGPVIDNNFAAGQSIVHNTSL
jgi:hypothetical protein